VDTAPQIGIIGTYEPLISSRS